MNIDIDVMKEQLKKVTDFKRLIDSDEFKPFMEIFNILEYKALCDIKDSHKEPEPTMRAYIAYYSALQNIKSFIVNVDRDLEILIEKIKQMEKIKAEDKRRKNIEINTRNGIINR